MSKISQLFDVLREKVELAGNDAFTDYARDEAREVAWMCLRQMFYELEKRVEKLEAQVTAQGEANP